MTAGLAYSLVLLNNTIAQSLGAMCLDGSPAAFYFAPTTLSSYSTKWQLHFQGGGWCYDALSCSERATTQLGSSTTYPPTWIPGGSEGILHNDCEVNPTFCNYNKVYFMYCDGNSFSGARTDPVPVPGGPVTPIHFRGHYNMEATLKTLLADYDFGKATHVHLSGCSAGGLSTFIHTNFVGDWVIENLPSLQVFKSSPVSGYFLPHDNILGQSVYVAEIQSIFALSNATFGVDSDCIASYAPADQWKCNFAEFSYDHIRYPVFVINSAFDSWQTSCIFAGMLVDNKVNGEHCNAIPNWADCVNSPQHCVGLQMNALIAYEMDMTFSLFTHDTFNKSGNGAFIHSCHLHCEAMDNTAYSTIAIGGVTISKAVDLWWGSSDMPASKHTYFPCVRNMNGSDCNPTCPDQGSGLVGCRSKPIQAALQP